MRTSLQCLKPLRIFGGGVRAQLIVDLIAWQFANEYCIEGFYDDRPASDGKGPGGFPILGTFADGLRDMARTDRFAMIATGSKSSARGCQTLADLRSRGVQIGSLVAPLATVSPSAEIGDNAVVFPGVFVGARVRIGDLFCAHGGAVVEHHSELGHNIMMGPRATLAGFVKVASHCFLGAGCTIHPECQIGRGTLVGAGSVVVRDIGDHSIAFGVPAVVKRAARAGDDVPSPEDVRALAGLGFGACKAA